MLPGMACVTACEALTEQATSTSRPKQCDFRILLVRPPSTSCVQHAACKPRLCILRDRSIWRSFIPFESYQVFQRGGYYSAEVIPDAVAAISLNTMYFYDSNKGGRQCLCLTRSTN